MCCTCLFSALLSIRHVAQQHPASFESSLPSGMVRNKVFHCERCRSSPKGSGTPRSCCAALLPRSAAVQLQRSTEISTGIRSRTLKRTVPQHDAAWSTSTPHVPWAAPPGPCLAWHYASTGRQPPWPSPLACQHSTVSCSQPQQHGQCRHAKFSNYQQHYACSTSWPVGLPARFAYSTGWWAAWRAGGQRQPGSCQRRPVRALITSEASGRQCTAWASSSSAARAWPWRSCSSTCCSTCQCQRTCYCGHLGST
jgi:hypothetical protein